jgi:hypothetical protein
MVTWAALLGNERTDEELAEWRAHTAERFDIDVFTCDECPAKKTCKWAFDPYNEDGDCLAEK